MQTITATSTFESELVALAFAGNEAVWIRKLLTELNFALGPNINMRNVSKVSDEIDPSSVLDFDRHGDDIPSDSKPDRAIAPTPVAVDNKSVEFSVNNPETSQRTKHLDTRYFKIRDYIRDLSIRVRHIGTKFNPADFSTSLPKRCPRPSSRATVTILAWRITHQPQPDYTLISFDLMSECLEDIDVEGECEYMC